MTQPEDDRPEDRGEKLPERITRAADEVLLLSINQGYYLCLGVDYLDDLLFGITGYPVPVRCMTFRDNFELRAFLGEGVSVAKMWMIHPGIVDRLRQADQLLEIAFETGQSIE